MRRDNDEEHARTVGEARRGRIDARDGRDSEDCMRHEAADERRGEDGHPNSIDVAHTIGGKFDVARPEQLEQDAVAYCKCDDVRREGQRRLVEAATYITALVGQPAEQRLS